MGLCFVAINNRRLLTFFLHDNALFGLFAFDLLNLRQNVRRYQLGTTTQTQQSDHFLVVFRFAAQIFVARFNALK
jgi:hypothetical protein